MKKQVIAFYSERYGRKKWEFAYVVSQGPKWITVINNCGRKSKVSIVNTRHRFIN